MRPTLRAITVALVLAAGIPVVASAQAAPAPIKLAYINSATVMEQAPGRAEAQAQLEKELAGYRQQVQRMGDSLNALVAAYNKEEVTLSPPAKEARQKTLRDKEQEYQDRTQKLNDQAQQRQAEVLQPILDQVRKVIDQVRADEGYSMIFDVAAGAVLVAADRNLEITDKVVARLKTMTAAKPAPAAARPAGTPTSSPAGVTRPKTPPQ
jgi:outer membrane protein